jgi:hypothetical protein
VYVRKGWKADIGCLTSVASEVELGAERETFVSGARRHAAPHKAAR